MKNQQAEPSDSDLQSLNILERCGFLRTIRGPERVYLPMAWLGVTPRPTERSPLVAPTSLRVPSRTALCARHLRSPSVSSEAPAIGGCPSRRIRHASVCPPVGPRLRTRGADARTPRTPRWRRRSVFERIHCRARCSRVDCSVQVENVSKAELSSAQ